jgi:sugar phosphate isomerase/epimerase
MMAIKRGVSSYSYQNLIFDRKMDYKRFIREVHSLNADGIEIIDESFINNYPFMTDEFVYGWNNEMARYNIKAITMDVFLDVLQFRDHVMTHAEACERLKHDLVNAARLGFQNVRCLAWVPIDVVEASLDTAAKLGIRVGMEIHAPLQIVYNPATVRHNANLHGASDDLVDKMIEMIERAGTRVAGLVPDMGLFQHSLSPAMIAAARRGCLQPEAVDFLVENRGRISDSEIIAKVQEKYSAETYQGLKRTMHSPESFTQGSAQQKDLLKVIPYIVSIHGKFYEMVEDPKNPGHFIDASIDYAEVFKYLKQGNFDGYINSELEGQRYTNDLPDNQMIDEIEQVRWQHAMFLDYGAV